MIEVSPFAKIDTTPLIQCDPNQSEFDRIKERIDRGLFDWVRYLFGDGCDYSTHGPMIVRPQIFERYEDVPFRYWNGDHSPHTYNNCKTIVLGDGIGAPITVLVFESGGNLSRFYTVNDSYAPRPPRLQPQDLSWTVDPVNGSIDTFDWTRFDLF